MERLLADDLWEEVRRRSKGAQQTQAAIAYFSSSENLNFRKNDLLIVDATDGAIRLGQTSARMLWRLHKRGVRLYSKPYLHAKVVLLDQAALIGSANASRSSTGLHEAGLLTDSPVVVAQLRSYLHQLSEMAELLTGDRLQRLKKIKVKRPVWRGGGRRGKTLLANGNRAWIISAPDLDDTAFPGEKRAVVQAEATIRKDFPKAEPTWLRWTGTGRFRTLAREGNQLVCISRRKNMKTPYEVSPPTAILCRQANGHWTRFYFDPNLEEGLRSVKWAEFQKLLGSAGITKTVGPTTACEISPSEAAALHKLWPRRRRLS